MYFSDVLFLCLLLLLTYFGWLKMLYIPGGIRSENIAWSYDNQGFLLIFFSRSTCTKGADHISHRGDKKLIMNLSFNQYASASQFYVLTHYFIWGHFRENHLGFKKYPCSSLLNEEVLRCTDTCGLVLDPESCGRLRQPLDSGSSLHTCCIHFFLLPASFLITLVSVYVTIFSV